MTANGNSTLNSTASWMWRACLKKEWSLHSCLSRCVSLLVLLFYITLQLVLNDNLLLLQAHESLTRGHFPAREETLQHLAALRLQFLYGEKARVTWSLENIYPVGRLRSRILQFTKVGGASGSGQTLERRRTSFLDGTLRRGLKTGSMKKQRMEEEQMLEMWIKEEMSATRASIVEKWSRLKGLDQHQAMLKYMTIIKEWPGYGSTLFDVEVSLLCLRLWLRCQSCL